MRVKGHTSYVFQTSDKIILFDSLITREDQTEPGRPKSLETKLSRRDQSPSRPNSQTTLSASIHVSIGDIYCNKISDDPVDTEKLQKDVAYTFINFNKDTDDMTETTSRIRKAFSMEWG